MTEAILDASAILAALNQEPGGVEVDELFADSWVSAVNLAEVVAKLIDNGSTVECAAEVARGLSCHVVPLDEDGAIATGVLRAVTRPFGLSLGDRACLALARREGCAALTTDRAWALVDVGVEIRMLR